MLLSIKVEKKLRGILIIVGALEFSLTLLILLVKYFFHPAVVQPSLLKRFLEHKTKGYDYHTVS